MDRSEVIRNAAKRNVRDIMEIIHENLTDNSEGSPCDMLGALCLEFIDKFNGTLLHINAEGGWTDCEPYELKEGVRVRVASASEDETFDRNNAGKTGRITGINRGRKGSMAGESVCLPLYKVKLDDGSEDLFWAEEISIEEEVEDAQNNG